MASVGHPSRTKGFQTRWARLREAFQASLPLPCGRCGVLIMPDEDWDLGHRTANALGGDPWDVWPEHRYPIAGQCTGNRSGGSQLRKRIHAGASREW